MDVHNFITPYSSGSGQPLAHFIRASRFKLSQHGCCFIDDTRHGYAAPRTDIAGLAQLGRRNLTADQFAYFIGRKYDRLKKAHGGERPARPDTQTLDFLAVETVLPREVPARNVQEPAGARSQNETLEKTAAKVALEHGVGERTVHRSADYSRAVNAIAEVAGDAARSYGRNFLSRSHSFRMRYPHR